MLNIIAVCLAVTALLSYLNHKFLRFPPAIGVMASALIISIGIIALDAAGLSFGTRDRVVSLLAAIDFTDVLMKGMLSILLFAGALHVDLSKLKSLRWQIGVIAIFSTSFSTVVIGYAMWWILPFLSIDMPLIYCLLFGALISPTDPIAVMGLLKLAGAPKDLEMIIAGESLFNDGVGVVIFSLLLSVLISGHAPTVGHAFELLLMDAGGGILYGLALGTLVFFLLKSIDNYQVEVLLMLATVMGGYALATAIHVSGPLAMVVTGLILGNHGRSIAMSDTTRRYVDMFWELMDEMLNAILFVLIGMEVLLIAFSQRDFLAIAVVILITLLSRILTVGLPVAMLPGVFHQPKGAWKVLTWGGLRGGISVALALSLPSGENREIIVALTYGVVIFSILVQGLTMKSITQRALNLH